MLLQNTVYLRTAAHKPKQNDREFLKMLPAPTRNARYRGGRDVTNTAEAVPAHPKSYDFDRDSRIFLKTAIAKHSVFENCIAKAQAK